MNFAINNFKQKDPLRLARFCRDVVFDYKHTHEGWSSKTADIVSNFFFMVFCAGCVGYYYLVFFKFAEKTKKKHSHWGFSDIDEHDNHKSIDYSQYDDL